MFIAILTYKQPLEVVDRFLQAHRDFLDEHYAAGDIITSGPRAQRIGGVIMLRAASLEAARQLLTQDPFNINGIADYQVIDFTPTKFAAPILSDLLS